MLAKSKLNSTDTLIFQALIDMEIRIYEFMNLWNSWRIYYNFEGKRYEMMKDNLRNKNGELYEIIKV